MNILTKIDEITKDISIIPGKTYYTGLSVKEVVQYHDTKRLHEVERFCWFRYLFNHSSKGITYDIVYTVMYDPRATKEEMDWFDQKCTDLFELGFIWSESSGTFHLPGVWSTYWEQVNRYDKEEWEGYMLAIKDSIKIALSQNIKL